MPNFQWWRRHNQWHFDPAQRANSEELEDNLRWIRHRLKSMHLQMAIGWHKSEAQNGLESLITFTLLGKKQQQQMQKRMRGFWCPWWDASNATLTSFLSHSVASNRAFLENRIYYIYAAVPVEGRVLPVLPSVGYIGENHAFKTTCLHGSTAFLHRTPWLT